LLTGGGTSIAIPTAAAEIFNPAGISVSPTAHKFPDTVVNSTSSPQSFTISLTSRSVTSINIIGTDIDQFTLTSYCGTLPTSVNCSVSVTFTPTSAGDKSAHIEIHSDDGEIPYWDVPLKGTGMPPNSTVTVTFAATGGPGAGSVHSVSVPSPVSPLQEISCLGGAGFFCQGVFKNGTTTITLTASPDTSTSTFGGWTGAGCIVTPGTPEKCVINNLSSNTLLTATFNYIGVAKLFRSGVAVGTPLGTLKGAYDVAQTGDEIRVRAVTSAEPLVVLGGSNTVTIVGGYDTDYLNPIVGGYSVLDNGLQINNGRVNVKNLILR
jgi:hypothetical protein